MCAIGCTTIGVRFVLFLVVGLNRFCRKENFFTWKNYLDFFFKNLPQKKVFPSSGGYSPDNSACSYAKIHRKTYNEQSNI